MTARGRRLRPAGLPRLGRRSASAGSPSRSTRVPTVTGHGLHCDARGGEELTDLGGVLNDVQRQAADNHRVQHAVVAMGAGKRPGGHLPGEAVKGLADAAAAPVEVPEKLGLAEPAVGEGVGVVVKRLRRCPRLELGSQVIVECCQRVVAEEPGSRSVQSAVRPGSGRRLVRLQVCLPHVVGAVGERRLHQAQRLFEVMGHALHKRVRHAAGIAQSSGYARVIKLSAPLPILTAADRADGQTVCSCISSAGRERPVLPRCALQSRVGTVNSRPALDRPVLFSVTPIIALGVCGKRIGDGSLKPAVWARGYRHAGGHCPAWRDSRTIATTTATRGWKLSDPETRSPRSERWGAWGSNPEPTD
jgi:hypothetical protein